MMTLIAKRIDYILRDSLEREVFGILAGTLATDTNPWLVEFEFNMPDVNIVNHIDFA